MFCMLGSAPLNLPVDVLCCKSLTCNIPSVLVCIFIPSTNEDKYVSNADNLCMSVKKLNAGTLSFLFVTCCSTSNIFLLTLKPLALTHFTFGGLNLNPATFPTEIKE